MAIPQQLPELDFEAMSAEDVLAWAYAEFGDRLCLTCSWQKQSSVLVHMVSELGLDVPVIELDTALFFAETYETRERLVERYGLKLIRPSVLSVAEQHREEGPNLWERDPDRCCHIRKVEPLERALEPYDAWISGIRREQSLTRKDAQKVRVERAVRRLEDPSARRLGREARRRPTSSSTRSRTTRCTTAATRRSAACRARGRCCATRTSARGAGPTPTRSSAGSTSTVA